MNPRIAASTRFFVRRSWLHRGTCALAFTMLTAFPAAYAQDAPTVMTRVMASRHQDQPISRVDDALLVVKEQFASIPPADAGDPDAPAPDYPRLAFQASPLVRADDAGLVRVYVHFRDALAVAELEQAGMMVEIADADVRTVQGWIATGALESAAAVPGVVRIRPALAPVHRRGEYQSEGVEIAGADMLQAMGIDGAGIRVGVMSDGIAGMAESQASGDLPAVVLFESARTDGDVAAGLGSSESGAEGTAMLEIIHDLAPGAELVFSNMDTSLAFRRAMRILAEEYDCDVIVDDVGWMDEPYFEDGALAVQAQQIADSGKVYVSAGGNAAASHYQGFFSASGVQMQGYELHDFGGGDVNMTLRLAPGQSTVVFMQWNTPYNNAAVDLDLALVDADGNILAFGGATQGCSAAEADGIAFEALGYVNDSDAVQNFELYIARRCPDDVNPEIELYIRGHGVQQEHLVTADSTFGHPAMPGVIGCGAVNAADEGVDEPTYYSSRGPGTVYTGGPDAQGLLTSRTPRPKPDMLGVDGVQVSAHGGFYNPFYGTSAAAPHVAACAALLWSAKPHLTAEQVRDTLMATARDLGPAGFDMDSGAGLVDALAAVEALNEVPIANDDLVETNATHAVAIDVIGNDSDADNDVLIVTQVTQPEHGGVVIADDGSGVIYRPEFAYLGEVAFDYVLSDQRGGSASATVTVTIGQINASPVAVDDAAICTNGAAVTVAVLANDEDPDNDALIVTQIGAAANGTVRVEADSTITYTASPGFSGADSFDYTISDGLGGSATATVSITVEPAYLTLDDEPWSIGQACGAGTVGMLVPAIGLLGLLGIGRGRPPRTR